MEIVNIEAVLMDNGEVICLGKTIGWQKELEQGNALKRIETEAPEDKAFKITSVARADLESDGYDATGVDDATMTRLAHKMADAYCDGAFWSDLQILADDLGIPRKPETN